MLDNLLKDANATAKRIANNPELIEGLSRTDLLQVHDKLTRYSPKAENTEANNNKMTALVIVNSKLDKTDENQADKAVNQARQIVAKTVGLMFSVSIPSFGKSMDSNQYLNAIKRVGEIQTGTDIDPDLDIDKKRFGLFKQLVGKEFVKPIHKIKGEFTAFLNQIAVPNGKILNRGIFLLPMSLRDDIVKQIGQFTQDFNAAIDELGNQWEEVKEDGKKRLGPDYNEMDYPTFDVVKAKFGVDYMFIPLNFAEAIQGMQDEARAIEEERMAVKYQDTWAEIQGALRGGFSDLVSHFANILGNDAAGKPKTFQKSTVDNLKSFLETFENRNITSDSDLAKLVKQAKDLIGGIDASGIRENEDLRNNLNSSFAEIAKMASELTVVKDREFDFED